MNKTSGAYGFAGGRRTSCATFYVNLLRGLTPFFLSFFSFLFMAFPWLFTSLSSDFGTTDLIDKTNGTG